MPSVRAAFRYKPKIAQKETKVTLQDRLRRLGCLRSILSSWNSRAPRDFHTFSLPQFPNSPV